MKNASKKGRSTSRKGARDLQSFDKGCSTVFNAKGRSGDGRHVSDLGTKKTNSSKSNRDRSVSDLDLPIHGYQNSLPHRQPDSCFESEDENCRDAPVHPRSPYAGKTLLINKKRKEVEEPKSSHPPVAPKKPRNSETVILENEDSDGQCEGVAETSTGAAIAVNSEPSGVVHHGVMSGAVLKTFMSRITGQVSGCISSELGGVKEALDRLVSQVVCLEKEVVELRFLVSCNGAIALKGPSQQKGAKVGKTMLETETPYIEIGFSIAVQSKVLSTCICRLLVGNSDINADRLSTQAANALTALLFGLGKDKSKSSYREGGGKLHANLRFMYTLSMVYHTQHNCSGQFEIADGALPNGDLSEGTVTPSELVPRMSDSSHRRASTNYAIAQRRERPTQPKWLRTGFIKLEDLQKARNFAESASVGREKHLKQAPTTRDIAFHGCRKLYTFVTSSFHRRRAGARVQFFEDLGYLMVDWLALNTRLDKSSLSVSWAHEEGRDFDRNLSSVPLALKNPINNESTTKWNERLWSDFHDQCRDMIIFVTHDVVVVKRESVSKSKDRGVVRRLRRALNTMEIAAGFLVRYVQQSSIDEFIGVSDGSVRAIFQVAAAFRMFVQHFVWDPHTDQSSIKCDTLQSIDYCLRLQYKNGLRTRDCFV